MRDLFREASDWLGQQQRAFCAQTVFYVRGNDSESFPATKGKSNHEITDSSGVLTNVETVDFLIDVADLELNGTAIEPKPGDLIVEGTLSEGIAYEVMGVAGGPPWRWADSYRTRYRIHVKYDGAYPPPEEED